MADAKVGLTPMGDWLRFAGTLELAGMDMAVNQRRVQAILRSVPLIMPDLDLDSLELVEVWRGLRPCTPDGLPFLGRSSRHSNLTVAAGHAMIGMSMGPISGKLVADVVTGEAPSLDISALALDRFN
jgi:D-amino-acid dehydrogenase